MMPRTDGFGPCRALRADEGLREPPVLLVTALRKDSDSMVEGLSATVHGIVEQRGAFILVLGEPHPGTSFKVFLPRLLEAPVVTAVENPLVTGGEL